MKQLENYLELLQEGYLLSDKTISVDLDEFENRKKDKLLIIGVCGSGKTSLGAHLAKKYKADFFSDQPGIEKALENPKRMIIEGAELAILFKQKPEIRPKILDKPMIIMGMSAIKAGLRADRRDGTVPGTTKDWRDIYYFIRHNLKTFQKHINFLRKEVMKKPGTKIKEFKVPKFEPWFN